MKKIISIVILFFSITCQIVHAQIPQFWCTSTYGGIKGDGNIFTINADGSDFKIVYSFDSLNGYPLNNLLQASDGKFYGTAGGGQGYGDGDIFSIDPVTDSFKVLFTFVDFNEGLEPESNLIQGESGLLYGMTFGGGNVANWGWGGGPGVIFSFNIENNYYKRLRSFDTTFNFGCSPLGQNVIQAGNGKLYGFAQFGPYWNGSNETQSGVIFSLNLSDSSYADLYNFDYSDGTFPGPGLAEGTDGKFYGSAGGGKYGGGVIFSFDPSTDTYEKLFDLHDTLGEFSGTLVLDNDKFYGTCDLGGYGDGTIFSFDPSTDSVKCLYKFTGYSGENPGDLLLASDEKLYGATVNGGAYQSGDMFSFDPANNTFKDEYDFDSAQMVTLTEYNPNAGINQLSVNNNQLKIYPNPTNGTVTITSTKNIDEVMATNLLGQIIYVAQPKQTQFTFNIKETGMFFVTVTAGGETETKKVVVINK